MSIEGKEGEMQGRENRREELTPEEVKDPTDLICEFVEQIERRGIIAYGEGGHHGSGTLAYESTLIEDLVSRGYNLRTVFLEEEEHMERHVNAFYRTGNMSRELIDYLTKGFVRVDAIDPHRYKVELLELCKQFSIPVEFIDDNKSPDRDGHWYKKIIRRVGYKPQDLHMIIGGDTHMSHSPKMSTLTPVVARLDQKYPNAVISLIALTNEHVRNTEYLSSYNRLLDELESMGKGSNLSAIKTKGSPYEDMAARDQGYGREVKIAEAFNIIVMTQGMDLTR